jgi:hypothetical protein
MLSRELLLRVAFEYKWYMKKCKKSGIDDGGRGVYAKTAAPMARTRPPKEMAVPDAAPEALGAGALEVALPEEPLDDASEASGVEVEVETVTAPVPVAVTVELPLTMGVTMAPLLTGMGIMGVAVAMTELTRTEVAVKIAVEVTVMLSVSNVT